MNDITYKPIGIIHTPFTEKKETPIQGVFSEHGTGRIELFPQYADGLKDLEGFTHLFLLYHFHRAEGVKLRMMPYLEDKERGIFSIRHFNRPNPIGLSLVRLDNINGCTLEISEVDILDGTPLLDIKPYVPKFDTREQSNGGWVDNPRIDFERGKAGKHR